MAQMLLCLGAALANVTDRLFTIAVTQLITSHELQQKFTVELSSVSYQYSKMARKGAIWNKCPAVQFFLKTNRGPRITGITAN